jgi:hypothetical protein
MSEPVLMRKVLVEDIQVGDAFWHPGNGQTVVARRVVHYSSHTHFEAELLGGDTLRFDIAHGHALAVLA